jgi:hypothetical protein
MDKRFRETRQMQQMLPRLSGRPQNSGLFFLKV